MNSRKIIILGLIAVLILAFISFGRANRSKKLIIIDPGHGARDPGSISLTGQYEKDINLDFSKSLKKALRRKGYRVEMTRDDDSYPSLDDRTQLANSKETDLFLSIHCNAMEDNPEIEGIQVFYFPSGDNYLAAKTVLDSMVEVSHAQDRGAIESRELIVLKDTRTRSLLVELGFLTNPREAELLEDVKYQGKLIRGLVDGIDKILGED